jgi:PTS system cellobiose-specific IIA component
MNEANMEIIMGLIMHSGNAKSEAMEAIQAAKVGERLVAQEHLEIAQKEIIAAHHAQTSMLTKEAQGVKNEITLLGVHAQDHLMTSITFLDLAKEIVELHGVKTTA